MQSLDIKPKDMLISVIRHYQGPDIVAMIDLLIKSGTDSSYIHPDEDVTPLMLWFRESHNLRLQPEKAIAVAQLLINHSSTVPHVNDSGSSALWELCKSPNMDLRKSTELFEALLEKEAKDYVHPIENRTTLMMWLQESHDLEWQEVVDVAAAIAENSTELGFVNDSSSALWELCQAPKLDIETSLDLFKKLVRTSVKEGDKYNDYLNMKFNGVAPYFYLLKRFVPLQQTSGLADLTQIFIECGLDLNSTNRSGDNALTLLAKLYVEQQEVDEANDNHMVDIAQTLLDSEFNVNHRNDFEGHALNVMFSRSLYFGKCKDYTNRKEFVELLVKSGIEVTTPEDHGYCNTPLEAVVKYADMTLASTLALMKLLINSGDVSEVFLHNILQKLAYRTDHTLVQLLPAFRALLIDDRNQYRSIHLGLYSELNNPLLHYLDRRLEGKEARGFDAAEEEPLHELIDLFANCHEPRKGLLEDTTNWQTEVLATIHKNYHGSNVYDIGNLLRNHGANVKTVQSAYRRTGRNALALVPAATNAGQGDGASNVQQPDNVQQVTRVRRVLVTQRIDNATAARGNKRPAAVFEHDLRRTVGAAKRVNPAMERADFLAENE